MGHLKQIVVDCDVPSVLARFRAAALDDFDVRPYDDEEVARLAALGHTPETDPSVIVDGPHVEICFQKVDVERASKTPLHLDLTASDWLAEVERLTALGATVRRRFQSHAWMRDPEGNDFCVAAADDQAQMTGPPPIR